MQTVQYYRDFNGPMLDGADRHHGILGLLFGLIFLVIITTVAYYLVRALATYVKSHEAAPGRDPLDIARERFAKGEISKDELAEIKKELK